MTTKTKKGSQKVFKNAKRALVCADAERCFWTTDGKIIANLVELRDTLTTMTDEVFRHHVTKEKNDFATWIEHVLGDIELADAMKKAKKQSTALALVVKRLKLYEV
jgi:hypothetical protein